MQDYAEAVAAARDESCRCPLCGAPAITCTVQWGGRPILIIGCPCVPMYGARVEAIAIDLTKLEHFIPKEPDATPR